MAPAVMVGMVSLRETGISGNRITDQSAFFDSTYLRVQSLPEFVRLRHFSFELWLKIPPSNSSTYRSVMSSTGVNSDGVPNGFLLLLNPCNQLEYWLSEGVAASSATPLSSDCSVVSNSTSCPAAPCASGRLVYTATSSLQFQLPEGVWHVLTGPVLTPSEQEWVHVVFGFESQDVNSTTTGSAHNCIVNSTAELCTGKQVLYINKTKYEADTKYRHANGSNIEIGGTSVIPSHLQGSAQLGHFTGYLDEIGLYDHLLSQDEVNTHHHHGSTANQPITVTTDAHGRMIGSDQDIEEWEPVFDSIGLNIDWDSANGETHSINERVGVHFNWNG